MRVTVGIVCSIGVGHERGGRKQNEDNYLVCTDGKVAFLQDEAEVVQPATGDGQLYGVFDGMGGHQHGDIASTTAARVLAKLYRPGTPNHPARALKRYIRDAHRRLYWKTREAGPVQMGTTLVAAWLLGETLHWCSVGDSRIYLYRDGTLRQLSTDHTRAEFARRDDRPIPTEPDGLAQSFLYGSRGQGDDSQIRLELGPDADSLPILVGDRILLCSDGLSGTVDDVSIADVLRNTPLSQGAAVALTERAIARGSTDNITALVISIDAATGKTPVLPEWDDQSDESTVQF